MRSFFALTLFLLPLLSGCATHVTPHFSSMNFDPESMEVVGPAEGKSHQGYPLCWGVSFENYSAIKAVQQAIKSREADALINITADAEDGIFYPLPYCWHSIRVYGTAIRFKKSSYINPLADMPGAQRAPGGFLQSLPLEMLDELRALAPEQLYQRLLKLNAQTAGEAVALLGESRREKLLQFLLNTKGKSSGMSWKFQIDPLLSQGESDFINLYLEHFSNYKPLR